MSLSAIRKKTSEASGQEERNHLRCTAYGCPLSWSVESGDGRLCSYHAWEPSTRWPSITESLKRDGAWDLQRKREVRWRDYGVHPHAWAFRIRDRVQAGEHVAPIAVKMAEEVLKERLR